MERTRLWLSLKSSIAFVSESLVHLKVEHAGDDLEVVLYSMVDLLEQYLLLLQRRAKLGLDELSFRDVPDGRRYQHPLFGLDRTEADLDRELAAIAAQTEELQPGPHRPHPRIGEKPPRWATCRPRKRSGTSVSTGLPKRSSRVNLKSRSACVLRMTILPSRLTTTIASGAASRNPRNLASTFFRAVVSRMMLMTKVPVSVFSGLRLISTVNSLPSLRRPDSSLPSPMGRVRGSRT